MPRPMLSAPLVTVVELTIFASCWLSGIENTVLRMSMLDSERVLTSTSGCPRPPGTIVCTASGRAEVVGKFAVVIVVPEGVERGVVAVVNRLSRAAGRDRILAIAGERRGVVDLVEVAPDSEAEAPAPASGRR